MRSSSPTRPTGVVGFTRAVVDVAQRENISFMSGSLAYYAFVFVFPFGALLVFSLAVVGVERVADSVVAVTGATLSPAVDAFVQRNVLGGSTSGALGALVVSFVTVLWGGVKLFDGLDTAFSAIYGTERAPSIRETVLDALVLIVTVPLAVVGVSVATVVVSVVTVGGVRFAAPLVLTAGLTVIFLPLYYVFPDTRVSVREILPGVAIAAVGWMVLQQLFQVYVSLTGVSAGGVVGAVVLFLTWLYFASGVILLGCAVNAVHGGYQSGERERGRWRRRDRRALTTPSDVEPDTRTRQESVGEH